MSKPINSMHRSIRKLSLLRTLARLNEDGTHPTVTRLVREDDPRQNIPSDTLTSRRLLVNAMRNQGLLGATRGSDSPFLQLKITEQGLRSLAEHGGLR